MTRSAEIDDHVDSEDFEPQDNISDSAERKNSGNWTLIYQLILGEAGLNGMAALGAAALTGVLQAILVHLIANNAESLARGGATWGQWAMFVGCLFALGLALLVTMRLTTRTGNRLLTGISMRLALFLRSSSMPTLEDIGPDRIMTAVTRDLTAIAGTISLAFSAVQTASLIIVCLFLVTITSPVVILVSALLLSILLMFARRNVKGMRLASEDAAEEEGDFCVYLEHVLRGFREIQINRDKQEDLYDRYLLPKAESAADFRVDLAHYFSRQLQLTHGTWFILVGVAAFVAPSLGVPDGATTAVLLLAFLRAPLVDMTTYLPSIVNARLAIHRFYTLEADLMPFNSEQDMSAEEIRGQARQWSQGPGGLERREMAARGDARPQNQRFEQLRLDQLSYQYFDEDGQLRFSVGPLELDIRAGEVILISGGNGSGKTTFLKLLTGLYPPRTGTILVDGQSWSSTRLRELYSCVFTDFHLFQRLYGLEEINPDESASLLQILDLAHKVFMHDGAFSTTALSSGQRRRLALIAAYLEHRPILLFDEWTADQDPEFRRFFYEDLLPRLKAEGKTVIAVTHDQWDVPCADRYLQVEDGQILEQAGPASNR